VLSQFLLTVPMRLRICLVPALLGVAVALSAGRFESGGGSDIGDESEASVGKEEQEAAVDDEGEAAVDDESEVAEAVAVGKGRRRKIRRRRREGVSAGELKDAVQAIEAEAERVHGALKHFGNLRGLDGRALASMWSQAFSYTAKTTLSIFKADGTVFVSTGDIRQMWLRDSSVQLEPYLPLAAQSEASSPLRKVLEAAMSRQIKFILSDPYASAFYPTSGPGVDDGPNKESCPPTPSCPQCQCTTCAPECGDYTYQKDYELDALLFPLMLHYRYWKETGAVKHLNVEFEEALRVILGLLRTEQMHFSKSNYSYKPLNGEFNEGIGLVWSFAMPSDDQVMAGYNIPQNIMVVVALRRAAEMAKGPINDDDLAAELEGMAGVVEEAVRKYGVVEDATGNQIYAFQVDGWGNATTMDDANMPNLLWLPYLGYEDPAGLYEATRKFVLSGQNSNFFSGEPFVVDGVNHTGIDGLGSQHESHGLRLTFGPECHGKCLWHLGLIMQGMTANSEEERRTCMEEILSSNCKTNKLHEGFSLTTPAPTTATVSAGPTRSSRTGSCATGWARMRAGWRTQDGKRAEGGGGDGLAARRRREAALRTC